MWKKLLVLIFVMLVIVAIAWQYFKPVPPTPVTLVEPSIQHLRTTLELNAVVVNAQTVTITALLNGQIGQINAREGVTVKADASLAVLDNEKAQSLAEKATAELAHSEQKVSSATRSYSRIKNLSGAGNASKQSLDESLDVLRSAQAALTVAKANVKLAELELKNANVVAPFAGVIIEHYTEAGQWVEAGTPLFKLAATDGFVIEAQVDASDWAKVSLEQAVYLTTESAPDRQWQSTVAWIAPTVARNDRDAKAVAIRFDFGDKAPALLLGQEVDAELVLEQIEDALTLPLSVLVERQPNEYSVFTAVNDKAKLKRVEIGLQNATHAQIVSGLDESDEIISGLRPGLQENVSIAVQ